MKSINYYVKRAKLGINARFTTVPEEHRISDIELNYIEFLIDSIYFRRTFFNNRVFTEYDAFGRDALVIEKNKFIAKSAFQYISNMLGSIAIPSYYLVDVFGKYYVRKSDIENVLKTYHSFDNFYQEFINKINDLNIRSNESVVDAFNYLGDVEQERSQIPNTLGTMISNLPNNYLCSVVNLQRQDTLIYALAAWFFHPNSS